jgi:hypothetical protein
LHTLLNQWENRKFTWSIINVFIIYLLKICLILHM